MKIAHVNAASNTCKLEIELSWEAAEALVTVIGPQLLGALSAALSVRKDDTQRRQQARAEIDREADAQKARWFALADDVEREIARRSNGPGQRSALIKQIAAERGLTAEILKTILRFGRREDPGQYPSKIVALSGEGLSNAQIAQRFGITERHVRRHLRNARQREKERARRPRRSP